MLIANNFTNYLRTDSLKLSYKTGILNPLILTAN